MRHFNTFHTNTAPIHPEVVFLYLPYSLLSLKVARNCAITDLYPVAMAPLPAATRPYAFVIPSGETIGFLTNDVSGGKCAFDTWPDAKQNEYLDLMQGHLKDLYADGSLAHLCEATGTPTAKVAGPSPDRTAFFREDLTDGTSWKITQALRVSNIQHPK